MIWLPKMIQERLVIVLAHFVWQGVAIAAMLVALGCGVRVRKSFAYARMSAISSPPTSVRRKSRPLKRWVSLVCSSPSK